MENSSLGEVLNGLKVAHLSDLHIKYVGLIENKILEILADEKPDLIFVTGDSIASGGPYEPTLSFFRQLNAPLGVYAVLGNTEYSNENGSCILCHKEKSRDLKEGQNPIFLKNSFLSIEVNEKKINIIGVDDPFEKKSDLKTALKNINVDSPSILLAHSPEIFEEATSYGIDFLLCGHNHGGQIFLTKYLRHMIPHNRVLEFLEGFFQKGQTLMYVNRGIGTSLLPFRFGVKPEITFFTLSNSTSSIDLSREMRSLFHWDSMNSRNFNSALQHGDTLIKPIGTLSIFNNPPKTIFGGLSLSNLVETFDILNLTARLRRGSTATQQQSSSATCQYRSTEAQNILFDFESDSDLEKLNWECHKWFELSKENVTSGKFSLKASLPPGQYPGIVFEEMQKDWSKFHYLRMDVYNPSKDRVHINFRIDDHRSGLKYANRFDVEFELKPGMNPVSIPTDSIRTNMYYRPLNLKRIKRMIVFIHNNRQKREIYIDNIHLE